VRRFKK